MIPPVYLGKSSWWIWKASRLSIVAVNVRVIRAGDIGEAYLTVIARKLAMAGVGGPPL
jgi:putative DNA primase/helicase